MIQIYRYNDKIALNFEGHDTIYVSPNETDLLAAELERFSQDIRKVSFSNSCLSTMSIEDQDHD